MIPDIDIWRCAQLMINNHGEEAATEAAATADEWLAKGNTEAQRVWMRIAALKEGRTALMMFARGEPEPTGQSRAAMMKCLLCNRMQTMSAWRYVTVGRATPPLPLGFEQRTRVIRQVTKSETPAEW